MKNALKNREIEPETQYDDFGAGSIPALSTVQSLKLASGEAFFILEKKTVPKTVPCKSNPYRKKFLKEKTPYKLPTIIRPANGDWFIRYFYEIPGSPGKFKQFRVRDGINYVKDPEQKEAAAQELCEDIILALEKKEHNPFLKKKIVRRQIDQTLKEIEEREKLMSLTAAVEWLKETKRSKNKSEKYLREFTWIDNSFIPWCNEKGLERVDDPSIDHIEQFLAEMLENEEWEPRTYNNKISILTTFFNYLVSKRKMPVNPIKAGMLERIDNKAEKNKYYDQKTLELILPKVQKKPALQRFIRWTYYTCARGTELRNLRIRDIDLNIKKIVIMAEIGKTGTHVGKRHIPLCQELHDLILEEKLKDMPDEWYVFGEKGMPGPERTYHSFFSDFYYTIKKSLKLDFKFSIYSFKHTRVVDLLIAGFEPIKVMYLTGHTNWGSFQKYIRDLGAVMDKQMIGNTLKLNI